MLLSEKIANISDKTMSKHDTSIATRIRDRCEQAETGRVFTPRDFLDLGSRAAIDQTLRRLCGEGVLRKAGRGLYTVPRRHPLFGELSATSDAVAEALKGRDALRLQPAGALAAHRLGLTEQVPMRLLFLTDGDNRAIQLDDGRQIVLKKTSPRNMATAGRISGTVIQALRWLGKETVNDIVIRKLRHLLSDEDKSELRRDAPLAPAYWITTALRRIADRTRAETESPE